jgi:formylglycine-generating enzyme required for sulfatase activity
MGFLFFTLFVSFFTSVIFGQNNEQNLSFTVNGIAFEMIFVEGGTFEMGCTSEQVFCFGDERPVHIVELSDFYLGKFEVSQKFWKAIMNRSIHMQLYLINGKSLNGEGDDYPIYYVNYVECEEFCMKLNQLLSKQLPKGYAFSLPTEAQWEYAARGGAMNQDSIHSNISNINETNWYADNSNGRAHKTGMKAPNKLGIFDMCGNVMEWCKDWYYDFYYEDSPSVNPKGPESGKGRVLRGGGWNSKSQYCRVSFRHCTSPSNRSFDVGFRLALVANAKQ